MKKVIALSLLVLSFGSMSFASPKDAGKRVMKGAKAVVMAPVKLFKKPAKKRAGDGSPMPSCRPGTQGCNDIQFS